MEDRLKGITVALALVALSAIGVSFIAAGLARKKAHQVAALQGEFRKASQSQKVLEARMEEIEQQSHRERETTQELHEALVQEQMRNKTLAEQLEERQRAQAASRPQVRQAKSNIQAR